MRDIPQLERKPGAALVLSGGATKAFYFHLGVLKVLQPERVSSIIGTGAGAVLGTFIASGATVGQLLDWLYEKQVYLPKFDVRVKTLTSTMLIKPRYSDIRRQLIQSWLTSLDFLVSLPRIQNQDVIADILARLIPSPGNVSGIFNSVALENLFRSLLPSPDFARLDTDLYLVASDLDNHTRAIFNGHVDYEDDDNRFMTDIPIHKAVRAATTVPGVFTPVKLRGRSYVDGEVKHTLPVDLALQLADAVIVSHTYQPFTPRVTQSSARDLGWVNIMRQSLSHSLYERIHACNAQYSEQYPDKRIIWISPEADDLDFFLAPEFSFNPTMQKQMITCGEIAALKALEGVPGRKSA